MSTQTEIAIGILFTIVLLLIGSVYLQTQNDPDKFGAPRELILSTGTSTLSASLTIATTTPLSAFGTTTVAAYGSTTIQTPENTEYALVVLNSASSTIFQVDTANSSTSILSTLNVQTINLATCNGCPAAGTVIVPGLSWDFFDNNLTFIRPTTTVGIVVSASSTIERLAVQDALTASSTLTVDGLATFGSTGINLNTETFTDLTGSGLTNSAGVLTLSASVFGQSWDFFDNVLTFIRPTTTVGIVVSASSTIEKLQVQGDLTASSTANFAGLYIDASGVLKLPQGTGPTVDEQGEIALDTTWGQIVFFDKDAGAISSTTKDRNFSVGSTTRSASSDGLGFGLATTTWYWFVLSPFTITEYVCYTNGGTVTIEFGDGANTTTPSTNSTTGSGQIRYAVTANGAFTEGEYWGVSIGSAVSGPDEVTCTLKTFETRQ